MKSKLIRTGRLAITLRVLLFLLFPMMLIGLWATTGLAATITSTSSGGNWNAAESWAGVSRTGTITTSSSSTAVTGSGTSFTTELAAGSIITKIGGAVIGTVASITDNTNLTLTANAASSNTGIN